MAGVQDMEGEQVREKAWEEAGDQETAGALVRARGIDPARAEAAEPKFIRSTIRSTIQIPSIIQIRIPILSCL